MNQPMNAPAYFDIGLVVPLEEELIQVMERFPSLDDRSTDTVFCHVVDTGKPDIRMIVVQQQGMGTILNEGANRSGRQ